MDSLRTKWARIILGSIFILMAAVILVFAVLLPLWPSTIKNSNLLSFSPQQLIVGGALSLFGTIALIIIFGQKLSKCWPVIVSVILQKLGLHEKISLKEPPLWVTVVSIFVVLFAIGYTNADLSEITSKSINYSGTITYDGHPVSGARVDAFYVDTDIEYDTDTTDNLGIFDIDLYERTVDSTFLEIRVTSYKPLQVRLDTCRKQYDYSTYALVPDSAPFDVMDVSAEELRKYLGQIFLVGFCGRWDSPQTENILKPLINEYKVGGLIFYRRNIPGCAKGAGDTLSQEDKINALLDLTRDIRTAFDRSVGISPYLAIDQEGGTVSHIPSEIMTEMPAAMSIGASRCCTAAYLCGNIIGTELSLLGFNMNMAPVADVHGNKLNDLIRDRSFGGHHALVAPLVTSFYRGQHTTGIISVAKHFPGHGYTEEGLETPGLPHSRLSLSTLRNSLVPFRELIEMDLECIMTSHLRIPKLSNETVTFDQKTIQGLLRGKQDIEKSNITLRGLGFGGLVMTDDLCLPAITSDSLESDSNRYVSNVVDNVIRAFEAGHDILMLAHVFPNNSTDEVVSAPRGYRQALRLNEFEVVFDSLEKYIFEDQDSAKKNMRIRRLRESVQRNLCLKYSKLRSLNSLALRTADQFIDITTRRMHDSVSQILFMSGLYSLESGKGFPSIANLEPDDLLYIFFPFNFRNYDAIRSQLRGDDSITVLMAYVDKVPLTRELNWALQKRIELAYSIELQLPRSEQYKTRANEIRALVQKNNPSSIIYIINNAYQWEQLCHVLVELNKIPSFELNRVIAVILSHPSLLDAYVDNNSARLRDKISYVLAYSGHKRNAEIVARLLVEGKVFKTKGRLPVPVDFIDPGPDWALMDCGYIDSLLEFLHKPEYNLYSSSTTTAVP